MAGDRIPGAAFDLPQRALELLVGERLDLAAAVAHEMVVVLAAPVDGLEAGPGRADLEALDEPFRRQELERPVDARDPDGAAVLPEGVEDLLGGEAAVLAAEELDHGPPRYAAPKARAAESGDGLLCPARVPHAPIIAIAITGISIVTVIGWIAIPLSGLTVLSTCAGGFTALRLRRELTTAIALTGGIVVAVALFDVLPEAIDAVGDSRRVTTLVGAGFLGFFLAERLLVLHHRDEAEQARAHARVGALGAAGLSLHSFVDGLGIGLAFHLDTATGLLVFLAVVTHDFADGLNTVNFILSQSGDRVQAVRWLAVDSLAPLLGARPTCCPRRTSTPRRSGSC